MTIAEKSRNWVKFNLNRNPGSGAYMCQSPIFPTKNQHRAKTTGRNPPPNLHTYGKQI